MERRTKNETGRALRCKKPTVGILFFFLDASTHFYKRICPSVRWSVRLISESYYKSIDNTSQASRGPSILTTNRNTPPPHPPPPPPPPPPLLSISYLDASLFLLKLVSFLRGFTLGRVLFGNFICIGHSPSVESRRSFFKWQNKFSQLCISLSVVVRVCA